MFDNQASRCLFCVSRYSVQQILQSHLFLRSLNFEAQISQWCGVKLIKSNFADKGNGRTWFGHLFLTQVVLISSIKPISSTASLSAD